MSQRVRDRSTQRMSSDIGVPLGVVQPKATDSGPDVRRILSRPSAVRSNASSHEMRFQPGSGSPFGRVRIKG